MIATVVESRAPLVQIRRLALVYLLTGFVAFLAMGLLGFIMRLDQSGVFQLSLSWFYRILTLHGAGMVSSSLLAGMGALVGTLAESVRLRERPLWIGFLLYLLGMGLVVLATLVGGFAAGWTVLYPLPYHSLGGWSLWAAITAYVGYLLIAVGFALYCVEILHAVTARYAGLRAALGWRYLFSGGRSGADTAPEPIHLIGTVVALAGSVTALIGAAYVVPLLLVPTGAMSGMDPLLAKNLVYFFGHTMANLNIYIVAGVIYVTLPRLVGRGYHTSWALVLALNATAVLVMLPFFHHLYQDFVNPNALSLLAEAASWGAAVPALLVTIVSGLGLFYRSDTRWSVPTILIALGLWGWAFGGIGAVLDAIIGVNQVMHNTLWVIAYFHTYYVLGAVAFEWAYMYHLIGSLSGRRERSLSRLAAWVYGLGGAGFALVFFLSGADSIPRRYAIYTAPWQALTTAALPFVALLTVGLAWLGAEMFLGFGAAWRGAGARLDAVPHPPAAR